jgi:UPF0176 protein
MVIVASFYKFFPFPDSIHLRSAWLAYCQVQQIRGTILMAPEGINATISGSRDAINQVLQYICSHPGLSTLKHQESVWNVHPFDQLKVKFKQEIVTLGLPTVDPSQGTGEFVHPSDWNAILTDPTVTVVDTRNIHEVEMGTFFGAINPQMFCFRQFPQYAKQQLMPLQSKKVAMFCTGGIRCEKASSYLLTEGFKQVYQLDGGIIHYLQTVSKSDSLWHGDCFVFDQRNHLNLEHRSTWFGVSSLPNLVN